MLKVPLRHEARLRILLELDGEALSMVRPGKSPDSDPRLDLGVLGDVGMFAIVLRGISMMRLRYQVIDWQLSVFYISFGYNSFSATIASG